MKAKESFGHFAYVWVLLTMRIYLSVNILEGDLVHLLEIVVDQRKEKRINVSLVKRPISYPTGTTTVYQEMDREITQIFPGLAFLYCIYTCIGFKRTVFILSSQEICSRWCLRRWCKIPQWPGACNTRWHHVMCWLDTGWHSGGMGCDTRGRLLKICKVIVCIRSLWGIKIQVFFYYISMLGITLLWQLSLFLWFYPSHGCRQSGLTMCYTGPNIMHPTCNELLTQNDMLINQKYRFGKDPRGKKKDLQKVYLVCEQVG